MTKKLTFETNGCMTTQFIAGELVTLYFLLRYENAPEYFAHSLSVASKLRLWAKDGTVKSFDGQLVCYYPGCFVVVIAGADSANLMIGDGLDMEIEVCDVYGQVHIAQRPKSLNVKPQIIKI
jgi:hypothetical protein